MAVRSVAFVLVVGDELMTVGMTLKDVMEDEPTTVTKGEVKNDVVRPPYVRVGVVEAGLISGIGDIGDDDDEELVVVVGVCDEDDTDEVVEVGG